MSDESNTLDLTNVPDNVEEEVADEEEEVAEEEEEVADEEEEDEEEEEEDEQVEEEEQAEEEEEEEEEGDEEEEEGDEQAEEEGGEEQPEEEDEEEEEGDEQAEEEGGEEQPEEEEQTEEEEGQVEEQAEEEEQTVEETVEDVEEGEQEDVEEEQEDVEENVEEEQEEEQAEQSVAPFVTDNLCSLKTLVDVLGKWSAGEIKRWKIEDLLKEGSEVDENLDDLEKVVEIFQLLFKVGRNTFRDHNHLLQFDEYTLSGESRNLSEEKKVEILKTLTKLVVNISENNTSNEDRINILNNIY